MLKNGESVSKIANRTQMTRIGRIFADNKIKSALIRLKGSIGNFETEKSTFSTYTILYSTSETLLQTHFNYFCTHKV